MKARSIIGIGLILALFLSSISLYGQNNNENDASPELCVCTKIINDFLMRTKSQDIYAKTGISANIFQNSIVIPTSTTHMTVDLDKLYEELYNELKDKPVDFAKIKYIMLENVENSVGRVIFISGKDFMDNIQSFEMIKKASIYFVGIGNYEKDPVVKKIATRGFIESRYDLQYGSSREKNYEMKSTICLKAVEKANKKSKE